MERGLSKFQRISEQAKKEAAEDVFSPTWKPPKLDRNNPEYGRPKHGTLTERRGIAAGKRVSGFRYETAVDSKLVLQQHYLRI
ncbi:unnamed protein product [Soboliphyme baturini]|uniref:BUD13 homolog n=1 Tax=Soboliphyme baturini TaxID=241478 RepID=A0A183J7V5_9BILA|nr:unnamed protein product [Soboliphyme baturini]